MARMSPQAASKSREEAVQSINDSRERIQGQQAYYRGSPSSPAVKRAVARKMGSKKYVVREGEK